MTGEPPRRASLRFRVIDRRLLEWIRLWFPEIIHRVVGSMSVVHKVTARLRSTFPLGLLITGPVVGHPPPFALQGDVRVCFFPSEKGLEISGRLSFHF